MKKIFLAGLLCLLSTAHWAGAQQNAFELAKEHWEKRGEPASLKKAIEIYQKVYESEPSYALAERLAYANYFLADAFEQGDAKAAGYYQGYEWGLKALNFDADFKKLTGQEGKSMGEAVAVLGKDFAGGIFWTATSIGKWAKMKGILKTVKYSKQARKMIEHLYSLDKTFYHGGPARWLATFYAVAPGIFGGDMKKSKQYYAEALSLAPDYFATSVLMAENYAAKSKDRALYDKLLGNVLSQEPGIIPGMEPEQKVEQEKAQKLGALKLDE
ncbi:MAG: TRAP transporter TatT component family protein [bacterium]|nr:TRAP transporter TatT component family protein [bacterium]